MEKRETGFTLIELLVVIAIIGILALAATTAYVGSTKKAARSEAYSNLQSLRLLEEQFFAENGSYAPLGGGTLTGEVAIRSAMPRFYPGSGLSFNYEVTSTPGVGLATPVPVPYTGATAPLPNATTPCFIATAKALPGTRVVDDNFAIDCNNNRNF